MKASLLFGFVSLALLPLCAEELTLAVNSTHADAVTDDQTFTITDAPTLAANLPPVLTATLSFTYPSETPDITEVANEKLAIACDTDGQILVANGDAWLKTGFFVKEDEEVPVSAAGKFDGDTLKFNVTLGSGEAAKRVEVTAPASGTDLTELTLTELTLAGEGTAKDITLAVVNTAIIPTPDGESQDTEQVAKYVEWLNNTGSAMSNVTDTEALADAFAMNVGGTPKLEITAIDVNAGTITVEGSCAGTTAPLGAINGKLYITYAETLSGTPQSKVADITVQTEEATTITLPEGARFVKAHVALTQPPAEL